MRARPSGFSAGNGFVWVAPIKFLKPAIISLQRYAMIRSSWSAIGAESRVLTPMFADIGVA